MTPDALASAPVLDEEVLATLRELGGSDAAAFVREIFAALFDQGDVIVALCADPDAEPAALAATGHRLKGAAGTVGAMRLSAAAQAVEAGAHDVAGRSALRQRVQAELDILRSRVDDLA